MKTNLARAIEYMERCGLQAIIASSPANVFYLTGYQSWIDPQFQEWMMNPGGSCQCAQRYAVLTRTGRVGLVVGPAIGFNAAELGLDNIEFHGQFGFDSRHLDHATELARNWTSRIINTDPASTPESALAALLSRFEIKPSATALDYDGLSIPSRQAIKHQFGHNGFRNCSNLFRLIRMVKTEAEIGMLRCALEISESACDRAISSSSEKSTVARTIAHYASHVAAQGAEYDHFAYSPQGLAIATTPPLNWSEVSATYVDYGCKFGSYFSDSGITLAGPRIDAQYLDVYLALKAGLDVATVQLHPGMPASRAHHWMMDELLRHGISSGSFPHGHGVGLEVRDYPIIVPANGQRIHDDCVDVDSDLLLEPGMVINLELAHFAPGAGSMNLEVTLLITADGAEPLAPQARDEPILLGEAAASAWMRKDLHECK